MTPEQLVERIKAEEFLESRGYQLLTCLACNGKGWIETNYDDYAKASFHMFFPTCWSCDGAGMVWTKPGELPPVKKPHKVVDSKTG